MLQLNALFRCRLRLLCVVRIERRCSSVHLCFVVAVITAGIVINLALVMHEGFVFTVNSAGVVMHCFAVTVNSAVVITAHTRSVMHHALAALTLARLRFLRRFFQAAFKFGGKVLRLGLRSLLRLRFRLLLRQLLPLLSASAAFAPVLKYVGQHYEDEKQGD